ncbi:MAG: ABC transporter ATP-binding protein [Eubacteriaceae bacterium]|nr:ABC transporter ATP-binding protein [Eubacteriaceae bacterium]
MSGSPVISVKGLTAGYGSRNTIADVSFTIEKGEILCLVGESGCGKSTILRSLFSSPEIKITSGDVILDGRDLSELSEDDRREYCSEKMCMVFQSPGASFNPIRTYEKQFTETLKSHGKYDPATFRQKVAEAFAKVELTDSERILKQCPYALSGGMNQRVALALAMLLDQGILLCDEPTSALDATIQLQVAKELKRLRDECGVTMIVVTHNLALARYLADRIGVMYAGRLVEVGAYCDLLCHPNHPYTRSLMAAIPSLDGKMPSGLPGQPPLSGPSETGCEFRDRCPCAVQECADKIYTLEKVHDSHYVACCSNGEGGSI